MPPAGASGGPGRGPSRPGRADWAALRAGLDGNLVRPEDPAFNAARALYAPRFDSLLPVAVVRPAGTHDVSEAIRFARRHGLPLRPRSGGHSYVGASAGKGGIQLDLGRMAGTTYDASSSTVRVGGGTRLLDLHLALAPHGRTVPTGTCPTVGTGLALGGGIGVENRAYGLTCDSLAGLEVVTADGTVRTVGPQRHPDLFWASRGGGGGSFGVVTSLIFGTWPAQPMGFFQHEYAASNAVEVLLGWQRRQPDAPRDAWATLHLDALRDGSLRVRVFGLSLTGDGESEAAALAAAIGVQPVRTLLFVRSHADGVRLLAGCSDVPDGACRLAPHGPVERTSFAAGSDVLARPLTRDEAAAVLAVATSAARARREASVLIDPLGGRVGDTDSAAAAFPWRDAFATVQWYSTTVDHPGRDVVRTAYRWVATGHRAVARASAGGYVNYLEPGRPRASYYGHNFARLRAVRARYDPDGFFDSAFSVPLP